MGLYNVKLRDGTTFTAERSIMDKLNESFSEYRFRNVQGEDAPSMSEKDILLVPRSSVSYIIKERR